VDRTSLSDEFYRKAEERRKALAERANADPRARMPARSGARHLLPPHATAGSRAPGVILMTVLGLLALVACVASATAVVVGGSWLRGALNDPTSTTQNFYSALQRSDYARAYTYFSSGAQAHLSESAFADQFGGYDTIEGPVIQISIGAPQYSAGGNVALLVVRVTRSHSGGRLQVHQVTLVKEQGTWWIDTVSITFGVAATPTNSR
jgi:hypothetical protein